MFCIAAKAKYQPVSCKIPKSKGFNSIAVEASNTAKFTILPSSHFSHIKLTCKHKDGTQLSFYTLWLLVGQCSTFVTHVQVTVESSVSYTVSQFAHKSHTPWVYNICWVHFLHEKFYFYLSPRFTHHKKKILTKSLQTLWTFVLLWVSTNTIRAHGYWSRKFLLSCNSIHNLCLTTVTSIKQHKN